MTAAGKEQSTILAGITVADNINEDNSPNVKWWNWDDSRYEMALISLCFFPVTGKTMTAGTTEAIHSWHNSRN